MSGKRQRYDAAFEAKVVCALPLGKPDRLRLEFPADLPRLGGAGKA